jgi:hypothetical protein
MRGETKLLKNTTKVFGDFASGDGSEEFGFSGTGAHDRFGFALIGNGSASENECKSSDIMKMTKIVDVGSVNMSNKVTERDTGESGERVLQSIVRNNVWNVWKVWDWGFMPMEETPSDSVTKMFRNAMKLMIMDGGRLCGKFREGSDGSTNVQMTNNICMQQFT